MNPSYLADDHLNQFSTQTSREDSRDEEGFDVNLWTL